MEVNTMDRPEIALAWIDVSQQNQEIAAEFRKCFRYLPKDGQVFEWNPPGGNAIFFDVGRGYEIAQATRQVAWHNPAIMGVTLDDVRTYNPNLNEEYALSDKVDPTKPSLAIIPSRRFVPEEIAGHMVLIDGRHRMFKAIMYRRPMAVYVLNEAETESIILAEMDAETAARCNEYSENSLRTLIVDSDSGNIFAPKSIARY